MGIKSRIKMLESSIKKGPGFDPKEFERVSAKTEEQERLNQLAAEGDFAACLKYCKMTDEELEDELYNYRDMYIRILAEREGKTPNYRTKADIDFAHENIKAVFRYLEASKADPQAKPPVLKNYKEENRNNK
ncbi:hypothetical protein ACIQXQ_20660 [Peribacillus sp. NPDC097198]|uniref:hypothetical protein n=1 Tax=Peribacillus sp. NPDC097198 TaxID=3364397 RepID=UPI00380436DF